MAGGHITGGRTRNTDYFRQLRACQRHERLHEELGAAHAEEHYQGMESRADHRDLHDALEDAHDAYHDDHPRADNCDGLARSNPYGRNSGYGGYGYGNARGYGYGGNLRLWRELRRHVVRLRFLAAKT